MYDSEPTRYRGVRFDSKLEVRWARLFDALEVAYVYHPPHTHQWEPPGGGPVVHYTPDFWLPASDQFLEAKPFDPAEDSDSPRWSSEVAAALRKAQAVATNARFQGGTFGAVTLAPSTVPPITFLGPSGQLRALDRHGAFVDAVALYRCATCGGGYVDLLPEAHAATACPCCRAVVTPGGRDVLRPPLELPTAV